MGSAAHPRRCPLVVYNDRDPRGLVLHCDGDDGHGDEHVFRVPGPVLRMYQTGPVCSACGSVPHREDCSHVRWYRNAPDGEGM